MNFFKVGLLLFFLVLTEMQAANQYWDSATNAGFQPGNGVWSTNATATNWSGLTGITQPGTWTNGNTAFFGAIGGVSVVTLDSPVLAQGVTITGSQYTLQFAQGGILSNSVNPVIVSGGTNRIEMTGGATPPIWNNGARTLVFGNASRYNELVIDGGGVTGGAIATNFAGILVGTNVGSGFNEMTLTGQARLYSTTASAIGRYSSNNQAVVSGAGTIWDLGSASLGVGESASAAEAPATLNNQMIIDGASVTNINGVRLGYFGNENRLTVTNGGLLRTRTGAFYVGYEGAHNRLSVIGGSGVASQVDASNQTFVIGQQANGVSNQVMVDGRGFLGSAVLTNVGGLVMGYNLPVTAWSNAENTLTITNSGVLYLGAGFTPSQGGIAHMVGYGGNASYGGVSNTLAIVQGSRVYSLGGIDVGHIDSSGYFGANRLIVRDSGSLLDMGNTNKIRMPYATVAVAGSTTNIGSLALIDGGLVTNVNSFILVSSPQNFGFCNNFLIITNGGQLYTTGTCSIANLNLATNNGAIITGPQSQWNFRNGTLTIGGTTTGTNNFLTIDQGGSGLNLGTLTLNATNQLNILGGTLTASNVTSVANSRLAIGDGVQAVDWRILRGTHTNLGGVLVSSNATVSGIGRLTGGNGGVLLANGSTLIPGEPGSATNTIGTIHLGNSTWYGGMTLDLNVTNVAGTNGSGWDLVRVVGNLDYVADASGRKLKIKLDSLGETVGGFTPNAPQFINLVDFSASTISTNDIELDTSKFQIGSDWFLEVTAVDIRYVHRRPNASIYVATNGNNLVGTNWATAFTSLSNALNFAQNYDTIYMAGHTFYLTNQVVWNGKAGISILGGYAATNNAALPGDRDIARWPTLLVRTSGAFRVILASGITNGTIEGVTLTGGALSAASGATTRGAGLYASNCVGLLLADCVITNNNGSEGSAAYGGGVGQLGGVLTIRNCVIKANSVTGVSSGSSYGSGLYVASGICSVSNTVIANNRGYLGTTTTFGQGGGIWSAGRLNLRNCLIYGNTAGQLGHGIFFSAGTAVVENCTIANNYTNGIYQTNGVVMITNSIVWGNVDDLVVTGFATNSLNYSSIEDGDNLGNNGCIQADPLFENGFYLGTASLCVDAGANNASDWALNARTTRSDGQTDAGVTDLGYHYPAGADLTYAQIYVATNGADTNLGTNWGQAFRTITKALSVAVDGSVIRIGEGRYTTNGIEREVFAMTIDGKNGVQLLGAGRGATIIDARSATNRVLAVQNCSRLVVADMTIMGGSLSGGGTVGSGGGLYFNNCDNVLISSCVIASNQCIDTGTAYGGGLQSFLSSILISNCLFYANRSTGTGSGKGYGGGIALMSGQLRLVDSDIANNATVSAASQIACGVGLFNNGAFMELRNCLIRGNSGAHTNSGAIYTTGGQLQLIGCTLAYNRIAGLVSPAGLSSLTNSILWGNTDDICSTGGVVNLAYCNIENGDSNGFNGCISADPRFEYGFYLGDGSPCANAGTNAAVDWGLAARTTRIDGQTDTGMADLGYHYPAGFDLTYADIYVATNGSDGYLGTNSTQPFRTLTKALTLARAGSRIHLATGIYSNKSESMPLIIEDRPGLEIRGTNREATVLHGMNAQRVLTLVNNNGRMRFERLTVTGGTTNSVAPPHPNTGDGAGFYVDNCGDLILANCSVISNNCKDSGIALGGGLMAQLSGVTLTNCAFIGNKAMGDGNGSGYGGGVAFLSGNLRAIDCDFANNAGTSPGKVGFGAALYNTGFAELRNCLVRGNTGAYTNGGAIATGGGDLQIIGSTLAYNGIACVVRNAGAIALTNSILWGNTDDLYPPISGVKLSYCNMENGDSNGIDGCISSDPLFTSGFFLGSGSPCIDTGTNSAAFWGMTPYTTQTSGDPDSGRVDIGYHYTNTGGQAQGLLNIYVTTNGLDTNSGTNWSEAFRTITKALSVAVDGSIISVGQGRFTPGTGLETFPLSIIGRNGIQMLGAGQNATVIDAQSSNRVLTLQNNNGRVVLADLTIMNGQTNTGTASGYGSGGGLYIDNCGNVQILNCTIASNQCADSSAARGGGLMAQASAIVISNCYFNDNLAAGGGNGYGRGGALSFWSGTLRVINSVLSNNRSTSSGKEGFGAALYNGGASELRNCLVQGNSGIYTNGGALCNAGGSLQIIGSTLAYNGVVSIVQAGGTIAATNSIFWGNVDDIYPPVHSVNLAYCNIENGDNNTVNGCISSDPLFSSGFYLGAGSPCIDTGTNNASAWNMDLFTTQTSGDLDSGRVDIGYHYTNGTGLAQGLANIYVATTGLDTNSGTNWTEAFRTLTKGLSMMADGSVVRIGAGSYTNGLETFPLTVQGRNGFQILGAGSDKTVLDARLSNRVMRLLNSNGRVVIDGIRFTGGKAAAGAGITVDNCGDVIISDCVVISNQAYTVSPQGGGIWLTRSAVTISNCLVAFNTATRIPNGSAYGGGIDLDSGVLLCRETILSSNSISNVGYGGGLRVGTTARAVLRNCLVATNDAPVASGDGIYSSGSLICENVTVANNQGQGVFNAGTAAITNSILWGNGDDVTGTVTLAYCDIEDGDNNTTNGCISEWPGFIDPAQGNYQLVPGAAVASRGIRLNWMTGAGDLAGSPRVQGGLVDMGAYEAPVSAGSIFIVR